MVKGVTVSNGLGWSPDGSRMYYADSPLRRVDVFDYDPATGEAFARRPFADLSDAEGVPDGLTVDLDGCVWVAMWGGSALRRLHPRRRARRGPPGPGLPAHQLRLRRPGLRRPLHHHRQRRPDRSRARRPAAGRPPAARPPRPGRPPLHHRQGRHPGLTPPARDNLSLIARETRVTLITREAPKRRRSWNKPSSSASASSSSRRCTSVSRTRRSSGSRCSSTATSPRSSRASCSRGVVIDMPGRRAGAPCRRSTSFHDQYGDAFDELRQRAGQAGGPGDSSSSWPAASRRPGRIRAE